MSVISKFLKTEKTYPFVVGLAAGLYPLLFYYSHNFSLINSWNHFWYFIKVFLVLPIVSFTLLYRLFSIGFLKKWQPYVLPFLSVFAFLFFLKICLYAGVQKKLILAIFGMALLFAWFLHKHYKKLVVFQFLLAVLGLYSLSNILISQSRFSEDWRKPVDEISTVKLKSKPNIYLIQPDGYPNFSELHKGPYNYQKRDFENFLKEEGFTLYMNFRSNYPSTLSTNSSLFEMKHHYYNNGVSFSEGLHARDVIMGENTVLSILKNNGYKTHFLSESAYFMLNRPEIAYDYTNFKLSEIDYFSTGFEEKKDVLTGLKPLLHTGGAPQFFFMEIFNPGHITGREEVSKGAEEERGAWLESLEESHKKLQQLIDAIRSNDPNGLIIIMADHGGFVGFDYTQQIYTKTQDRDLIYSMFSSQLSIKWPENITPKNDSLFKTPVNLFRIIFSELAQEEKFLQNLQEDASYVILKDEELKGVYKYIDEEGEIVLEKHQ